MSFFHQQNRSEAVSKCNNLYFNKVLTVTYCKLNVEVPVVTPRLCFCNLFDATIIKLPILQVWVFFSYCHSCHMGWPDSAAPDAVGTGFCRRGKNWIILEIGNGEEDVP